MRRTAGRAGGLSVNVGGVDVAWRCRDRMAFSSPRRCSPGAGDPGGREGGMYTVLLLGTLRVPQGTRLSAQSKALFGTALTGGDGGKADRKNGMELPGKAKHCCLRACVNVLWR